MSATAPPPSILHLKRYGELEASLPCPRAAYPLAFGGDALHDDGRNRVCAPECPIATRVRNQPVPEMIRAWSGSILQSNRSADEYERSIRRRGQFAELYVSRRRIADHTERPTLS